MKSAAERTKKMTKAQLVKVIEGFEIAYEEQKSALVASREKSNALHSELVYWHNRWRDTEHGQHVEATRKLCPELAMASLEAHEPEWTHTPIVGFTIRRTGSEES